MVNQEESIELIKVGPKDLKNYLNACLFAYSRDREVIHLISRGHNIKTAIDVAAILIRQYVVNPVYEITIGSEKFEERYVSTIDIVIKGKRKLSDESESIQEDKISER